MVLTPKSPDSPRCRCRSCSAPAAPTRWARVRRTVTSWIDIAGGSPPSATVARIVVTLDGRSALSRRDQGRWQVNLKARVLAGVQDLGRVGVTVFSENPLTGRPPLHHHGLLTFVALDAAGNRLEVPPLKLLNAEEKQGPWALSDDATSAWRARARKRVDEAAGESAA